MRRLAVTAIVVGGCSWNAGDLFAPPIGAPECQEQPWAEATIARTAAATLVAATRPGCGGFPDPVTDYRVYRVGTPWLLIEQSTMQTSSWERAIVRDGDTYTLQLGRTCVLDDVALRCVP